MDLRLQPWSLRRTLLAILLTLTISVWGVSAVIVYLDADQESQELFDQSLSETAHLLLALAGHEVEERMAIDGSSTLVESSHETHIQYLLFQIWDAEKRLRYKNRGAPDQPFATDNSTGFGYATVNGQRWRIYTTWNAEHRLQIQVGEPSAHRKEISGRFAFKLLFFALLIIPLLAGAIWWAVNRVFQVLQVSANQVAQRTPNDLQLVSLAGVPAEVRPLLQAINRLFERVSNTLEHEQRFTADAAHELRTPLAAIKTNLQVIQRARNEGERAEAIEGLGASVDRATRLVEQLMTLARLDPQTNKEQAQNQQWQSLDMAQLLTAQLPIWRLQAEKSQLIFSVDLQAAICALNQDSFLILLRNLLDNAFRYTPAGGEVRLSCRIEEGLACLTIADSGVGIAPAMRERVFDRFVRLAAASKPGSGLGLSIVKRIVEAHQASIVFSEGLNGAGLTVEIRFPTSLPV
ncbi:ATP-binding protein [Undibacterium sp. Ren11W]|uniref:ATP-binding protein n=1 Tax=Undibacterium sp. Ren11W TaxID=3413045 RepID=UPI003BF066EB